MGDCEIFMAGLNGHEDFAWLAKPYCREARAMRKHLRECNRCQAEYDQRSMRLLAKTIFSKPQGPEA